MQKPIWNKKFKAFAFIILFLSANFTHDASGQFASGALIKKNFFNSSLCDFGTLDFAKTICTIKSTKTIPSGAVISGVGHLHIMSGGSIVNTNNNQTISINIGGTLIIDSGGTIQANLNSLSATGLTVRSGGIIQADGLGHLAGSWTGNPSVNGAGAGGGQGGGGYGLGSGGGGYGGVGGTGSAGASGGTGGSTYGSNTNPTDYGSGGGSNYGWGSNNGHGGGILIFNITGPTIVDGTISANGAGAGWSNGGGSGGSIKITTNSISGTGTIRANGGKSGWWYSTAVGGGGGGRIAIVRSTGSPFSGAVTVNGGADSSAGTAPGSVGTIYAP